MTLNSSPLTLNVNVSVHHGLLYGAYVKTNTSMFLGSDIENETRKLKLHKKLHKKSFERDSIYINILFIL